MSDLLNRQPVPVACAVSDCERSVEYVGDVCIPCVRRVRADQDDWFRRFELFLRLERQVTTLLYARPERLRALVEQLDQEIYKCEQ